MQNKDIKIETWSREDFGERTIAVYSGDSEEPETEPTVPESTVLCDLCNHEFEDEEFPVTVVNGSRAYCEGCFEDIYG